MSNIEKDFSKKINKIDLDKNQAIDETEIKEFLWNKKKVEELWAVMKNHFESQSEVLQQFKNPIGQICERIIENENINSDQGKILFFYLKHFHNENDSTWRNIIKTIIEWNKWNRYENIMKEFSAKNNENDEEENQGNSERFNNLPWVQEIKQQYKDSQNLKRCNEILESNERLDPQKDILWLHEYKNSWKITPELISKINERLDLEMGYQLLEEDILSREEVEWLKEFIAKAKDHIPTEMAKKLAEKIELEETKIEINEKVDEEIERNPLQNLETISPWIGKIIPNREFILKNMPQEKFDQVSNIKEVENLVEKEIKEDNIWQYLSLKEWISAESKYYIANNLKKILIRHIFLHQWYRKIWWSNPNNYGVNINLESLVIENDLLESAFVKLSKQTEDRWTSFNKLKSDEKNQIIKSIFDENNYILFDIRLKKTLQSNNKKKLGENIAYIINYGNKYYKQELKAFAKSDDFINNIVNDYHRAKQEAEDEKKRVEEKNRIIAEVNNYIKQAKTVNVPAGIRNQFRGESSFKVLSRKQIESFKPYYDKIKWQRWNYKAYEWFCKLYEYSTNFYNFDWFWKLWLPNCLEAQDYLNYLWTFNNLQQNIVRINDEYQQTVRKAMREYDVLDCNLGIQSQSTRNRVPNQIASACGKQAKETNNELIVCAREFVKLRKKSGWSYRPDNFMWIKLDRNNSNKNPNNNSDVDDIIRDSLREGVVDKVKSFWRNATWWCYQQAFWDLIWLWTWLVFSGAVMTFTGNPALAGASYYLGSKVWNWVAQVVYDAAIDWLLWKGLGLWWESWANRYDGLEASAGLWIWICKRDENGNVIQAKSQKEWIVDTAFWTIASSATFGFWAKLGISINNTPFKFASIDEFISKPISNISAATMKASLWTQNYKSTSIDGALMGQIKEEYWVEWMSKKIINVFLVTAIVKWYKNTYGWIKGNSKVIWEMNARLNKVQRFLSKEGIEEIGALQKVPEKKMKELLQKGFWSMVDELAVEARKWWRAIIAPAIPLAVNGLLSRYASPTDILKTREAEIKERLQLSKSQEEIDKNSKLLEIINKQINYVSQLSSVVEMDNDEALALSEEMWNVAGPEDREGWLQSWIMSNDTKYASELNQSWDIIERYAERTETEEEKMIYEHNWWTTKS